MPCGPPSGPQDVAVGEVSLDFLTPGIFMGEITSENMPLACDRMYARMCGSPSVCAPVVTQLVTQALTLCHAAKASFRQLQVMGLGRSMIAEASTAGRQRRVPQRERGGSAVATRASVTVLSDLNRLH